MVLRLRSRTREEKLTCSVNIHFRMLNNNKLMSLGKETLSGLSHLRTLKLTDNALACDCHLAWLSRHLRTYPRLGQHTRCASPVHLKDRNLVDLQVSLRSYRRLKNSAVLCTFTKARFSH